METPRTKRQFIVGGNCRRCGLAVSRHVDFESRILVLPKVWRRIKPCGPGDAECLGATVVLARGSLTRVVQEGAIVLLSFGNDGSGADLHACLNHVVQKQLLSAANDVDGVEKDDDARHEDALATRKATE